MLIQVPTRRTDTKINKRRTHPQEEDHLFSPSPNQRELGSAKPCAHVERTQPTTHASGQDAACCVTQRNARLTRGPYSPGTVRCAYSDCAEPSMTRWSPWSSVIEEETLRDARRTWNTTEWSKLILTFELRLIRRAEQGFVIAVPRDT